MRTANYVLIFACTCLLTACGSSRPGSTAGGLTLDPGRVAAGLQGGFQLRTGGAAGRLANASYEVFDEWEMPVVAGFPVAVGRHHVDGTDNVKATYSNKTEREYFFGQGGLEFGYYIRFLDDALIIYPYAHSNFPFGTVERVAGSAGYSGAMVGLYEYRGTIRRAGPFAADAAFEVDFDADTLTGTITGFRDGSGAVIDPGWSIDLSSDDLDFDSGTGFSDEDSIVYQFHLPQVVDGRYSHELPPEYLSGELLHAFDNGSVLGSFGARRQHESHAPE